MVRPNPRDEPSTAQSITPQVSVIIPCYNQGHFLGEAVQSIIDQTFRDWECIIVNDGSTDSTKDVAGRFLRMDNRVRYFEQRNKGLAAARNRGLHECRGKFIQFLDADDVILPEKIAAQMELLGSTTAQALAYCDYYKTKGAGLHNLISDPLCEPRFRLKRPLLDIASRWETDFSIPAHCFLFDARLFFNHRIEFNEKLPNHEDWDCWMRIFATDPIVKHQAQKSVVYRIHENSLARDEIKMWRGFRNAINSQLKLFRDSPEVRALLANKRAQMRTIYWSRRISLLLNSRPFRKFVPWTIQKRVANFCRQVWRAS